MKAWKGRLVRLNCRVTTKGGDVYEEGEVLRVDGWWRGRVHLVPVDCDRLNDNRPGVRHVPRNWCTLLAQTPP